MKKQLRIGLLSAGLVMAMLPGVVAAKDDGKSDCKKGGWTEFVREDQTAFADQDECVAYVARGGTLTEPTQPPDSTFESVCGANSGDYKEIWLLPYSPSYSFDLAPACLWWNDITQTAWETARSELVQFCPVYSYPPYWQYAQDQDYFYYGCTEAT